EGRRLRHVRPRHDQGSGGCRMSDLRSELLKIREEHGKLTPRLVVSAASDADHPLHSHFEWDDGEAADRYRLLQARDLISTIRVVYRRPNGDLARVREFHSIRMPDGRSFEPVDEITADPLLKTIVLRQMERDWRQLKQRYDQFEEFTQMVLADVGEHA